MARRETVGRLARRSSRARCRHIPRLDELESRQLLCDAGELLPGAQPLVSIVGPQPAMAQAARVGSSPFAPPRATDHTFVIDSGPGLDTGCTFRSGGPLLIDVQIDRYIGDRDKLLANGLLPTTINLRLPAFDVDVNGGSGGTPPEVDRVTFVGADGTEHVLGNLDGNDGIWQINTFAIDTSWLDFGSYSEGAGYTPGRNTLRIDIDTASGTNENWCTAIDWVALDIPAPDPVFFVHGILSEGATWKQPFLDIRDQLGLPIATIDMGALDSIGNNAGKIANLYSEMRSKWTVGSWPAERELRIAIVAHSKGGLDSREFISRMPVVDTLVQNGTPNAGSPLADAVQRGVFSIPTIGLPAGIIAALAAPAGIQLTTAYMALYNLSATFDPSTTYVALAGDYQFDGFWGSGLLNAVMDGFYGGPSDTIVPVWSVHAISPPASPRVITTSGSTTDAMHTGMTASPLFAAVAKTYARNVVARPLALRPASAAPEPFAESPPPQAGVAGIGEPAEHRFVIDSTSGTTTLGVLYDSGEIQPVLVSPSGQVYDPAGTLPSGVAFASGGGGGAPLVGAFTLSAGAETGEWTLKVQPTVVDDPSGKAFYLAFAQQESSPIALEVEPPSPATVGANPLVLQARLTQNGAPMLGGTVTARLRLDDTNYLNVPLHDDGVGPDTAAGDGVYAGEFSQAIPRGTYTVAVDATGSAPKAFSRSALTIATIAEGGATLDASAMTDEGIDTNGNGLFERLDVHVSVPSARTGRHVVVGTLRDAGGNVLATASVAADLVVGDNTVTLPFDGRTLFDRGVDGPYQITTLTLQEDVNGILATVDQKAGPFTTTAYLATAFEHDPVRPTGDGADEGIDANANGMFEQLHVSLDVVVDTGGAYQWSGELVGTDGRVASRASNTGFLTEGVNTLTFLFDGREIGNSGSEGPYQIRNLVVAGSGGAVLTNASYSTAAYRTFQFESDRPLLGVLDPGVINEGATFRKTIVATSTRPGVSTLTYSLVAPPPGASIDPRTGELTFTPAVGPGIVTLAIRVVDDANPALDTVREQVITVKNVAPAVTVGANATLDAGQTLNRQVTFRDPGADRWKATVDYGDGGGPKRLEIQPGQALHLSHRYRRVGSYTVTVVVRDGNGGGKAGVSQFSVTVRPGAVDTTGPTLRSFVRQGVHYQPTRLVLTFDEALDPSRATNLANYRLFVRGPWGLRREIAVRSAEYDETRHTVTLSPTRRLRYYEYHELVLSAAAGTGLADRAGNPLDGDRNGRPGDDFRGFFHRSGLVSQLPWWLRGRPISRGASSPFSR